MTTISHQNIEPSVLGRPADLYIPAEGGGPGLVLLGSGKTGGGWLVESAKLMAEEGYLSLALNAPLDDEVLHPQMTAALLEKIDVLLRSRSELQGKIGLLDFMPGGAIGLAAAQSALVASVVIYGDIAQNDVELDALHFGVPTMFHCADSSNYLGKLNNQKNVSIYSYPNTSQNFFCDEGMDYVRPAALIAYSRTLSLLRRQLGPNIDLEALWDEHLKYEFAVRDPLATIETMVDDCYVNHIPTMTGGVGRKYLYRFYKHHFIFNTPDTEMVPISRTVGTDRVVDEFVAILTHDREIDWLLPGVPPTGKKLFVPTVSIVCFRGRKLYHEHLYWDQASVLVQLGLLDPQGLPVAGVEVANKVMDNSLPSNLMMPTWKNSEGAQDEIDSQSSPKA